MSPFVQETDSIEVFSVPKEMSFTDSKVDFGETSGVADEGHIFPMPKRSTILMHAWVFVRNLENKQIAEKRQREMKGQSALQPVMTRGLPVYQPLEQSPKIDPKSDALSIELRAPLLLYSTIPNQIVNLPRDTA